MKEGPTCQQWVKKKKQMTVHSVGWDPYLQWALDPINPNNAENNNVQIATDHPGSVRIQGRGTAEAMPAPAVPGFSQTTCSIHISVRILSIPYFSFTQGHQKFLYSYHKQCCLQPQPPQELTLGGSFEVPP